MKRLQGFFEIKHLTFNSQRTNAWKSIQTWAQFGLNWERRNLDSYKQHLANSIPTSKSTRAALPQVNVPHTFNVDMLWHNEKHQ